MARRPTSTELLAAIVDLRDGMASAISDGFAAVHKRLDEHDRRFDEHDRRFDGVDRRFDAIDRRLGRIETRVEDLERRPA